MRRLNSNITAGVVILFAQSLFILLCPMVYSLIFSSHVDAWFDLSRHKPGLTILLNVGGICFLSFLPADPNPTQIADWILLLFALLSSTETSCLYLTVELCSVGGDNVESYLSHFAMTTCKELFLCLFIDLLSRPFFSKKENDTKL